MSSVLEKGIVLDIHVSTPKLYNSIKYCVSLGEPTYPLSFPLTRSRYHPKKCRYSKLNFTLFLCVSKLFLRQSLNPTFLFYLYEILGFGSTTKILGSDTEWV